MGVFSNNAFLKTTICLLLAILYALHTPSFRCSTIGKKILDDILGFDWGHRCADLGFVPRLGPQISHEDFRQREGFSQVHRYHDLSSKQEVTCPQNAQVIVIAGQSNSANYVMSKKYKNIPHVNFFNKKCYALDGSALGAEGQKESIAPAIASMIKSSSPYIFLTAGWGETHIALWGNENSKLSKYINFNLQNLGKAGHKLHAFIWIHGESDNNNGTKPDDYIFLFNQMKTQVLEGLNDRSDVKFIVTQTSKCDDEHRGLALNNAQKSLAKDKNTFITEVTDNLDNNYRYDSCHFNKFGVEEIAREIASLLN
jgi:hypothetical protein